MELFWNFTEWKQKLYLYYTVLLFICIKLLFIIKGFRAIVFIFIVISTTFRPICPPAFFRSLSNSGTYTELQKLSLIESTGVACSKKKQGKKRKEFLKPDTIFSSAVYGEIQMSTRGAPSIGPRHIDFSCLLKWRSTPRIKFEELFITKPYSIETL